MDEAGADAELFADFSAGRIVMPRTMLPIPAVGPSEVIETGVSIRMPGVRRVKRWSHAHVRDHVAMKEPIAGAIGSPGHVKGMAGFNFFCDDEGALVGSVMSVMLAVANRVHVEEEAMQVHPVGGEGRVDHAPVENFADVIGEVLRVWPRFSVYGGHFFAVNCGVALRPNADYKDAIVWFRRGRVNDEGARQKSFVLIALFHRLARSGRPIEIRAGLAGGKFHIARFAGRQ